MTISGVVTSFAPIDQTADAGAASATGAADAEVCAYETSTCATTNVEGEYVLEGVPANTAELMVTSR